MQSLNLRKVIAAGSLPSNSVTTHIGQDTHHKLGTRGTSPYSHSIWGKEHLDLFEGNNKHVWMDLKTGWCHLCQEPIGGTLGVHVGDRDHTNLQYFLNLYACFPRGSWSVDGLIKRCAVELPTLCGFATNHTSVDHLHIVDDAQRRAELEALLCSLCEAPYSALTHSLQGNGQFGFWYSGERIWKRQMTRMVGQMFPALSAGMMTNFTQKCWGRTNLDRMYDALHMQRIKRHYGWQPYENKEKKAFFMRQLLWEMECVEMRDEVSATAKLLNSIALRRMCFELIFLQSMDYMNRVQHVYSLLGRPSASELRMLNLN